LQVQKDGAAPVYVVVGSGGIGHDMVYVKPAPTWSECVAHTSRTHARAQTQDTCMGIWETSILKVCLYLMMRLHRADLCLVKIPQQHAVRPWQRERAQFHASPVAVAREHRG